MATSLFPKTLWEFRSGCLGCPLQDTLINQISLLYSAGTDQPPTLASHSGAWPCAPAWPRASRPMPPCNRSVCRLPRQALTQPSAGELSQPASTTQGLQPPRLSPTPGLETGWLWPSSASHRPFLPIPWPTAFPSATEKWTPESSSWQMPS